MAVRVRRAGEGDIPAMTALLGELFALEADFTPDADTQARGLNLFLGGGPRVALVADEGGRVVGMATAQLVVSTAIGGVSALVEDVVVAADMRGTGVGALLLAAVEEWARGAGATRLTLVADKDNTPARLFYEKAGWNTSNLVVLIKTNVGGNCCPGRQAAR